MKINNNSSIKFGATYNGSAIKKEIQPELKSVESSSLDALDASGRAQLSMSCKGDKKHKIIKISETDIKPKNKHNIQAIAEENENSTKSANVIAIIKENKNSMKSSDNLWEDDSAMDYWRYSIYERIGAYSLVDGKSFEIEQKLIKPNSAPVEFDYDSISKLGIKNLAITTDGKGVRGSTLFAKNNKKYITDLKNAGINTVIDLRNEAPTGKAKTFCILNGLEYVHFPIKYDEKMTQEDINKLPEFIKIMNEGNYYIGCAEGTNRTDVAIGLNYLFNPDCKTIPEFQASVPQKSLSMLGKAGNEIIGRTQKTEGEYTITEDFVQRLGWKDLDSFFKTYSKRMKRISQVNLGI